MKLLFFMTVFISGMSHIAPHHMSKRVISGQDALKEKHPWFVLLKNSASEYWPNCGGTIIDRFWVLTAAHCLEGRKSIFLEFGTQAFDDFSISMTANKFVIHPEYNSNTIHNDVALIKLMSPLRFSEGILPIKLVSNADRYNTFEGSLAYIYGYGITDDYYPSDFSTTLRFVKVTVISNQQCYNELQNEVVIDSTLCAKDFSGNNASICTGDSGGPIITKDSKGQFIQIGVNSFVDKDNCMSGLPSGYARITSFLEFINAIADAETPDYYSEYMFSACNVNG